MASDILDRIGTYIKDNNTYFNSFLVNGVQLPDGKVIQFTDGKEKRFIGISDNFGTAGYIRSNPRITVPTSARRISSSVNHSGYLKQCRLVAYSWNEELTSEALMTKLVTDLRNINFTGNTRVPVLTIKNTNHNYLDVIKDEFLKEPKEVGGFGFVCVAIDFDLQYWSEECSICEINNTRIPMRNDNVTYWADLLGQPADNQDLVDFLNTNYSPITPTWANLEGDPSDNQDLIDLINASTPNVGANRVAFGDSVTGLVKGVAGFEFDESTGSFKIGTAAPLAAGSSYPLSVVGPDNSILTVTAPGSSTNVAAIYFGKDSNNFGALVKHNNGWGATPYAGSNVLVNNSICLEMVQNGNLYNGKIVLRGAEIYGLIQNVGSGYAYKQDANGFRIDTLNNIGTANSAIFQAGSVRIDNQTLSIGTGAANEILFTGGDNANIHHSGGSIFTSTVNGNIFFSTNNHVGYALRVNSNQTIQMADTLQVSGKFIYGDTASPFLQLDTTQGSILGYGPSTNNFQVGNSFAKVQMGGVDRLTVDTSGNVQIGTGTPVNPGQLNIVKNHAALTSLSITNTNTAGFTGWVIGEDSNQYFSAQKTGSTFSGSFIGNASLSLTNTSIFNSGSGYHLPFIFGGNPIIHLIGTTGTNYSTILGPAGLKITTIANVHVLPTHPFEVVTTNGNVKFYNWAGAGVALGFGQASPSDTTYALAATNNNTYIGATSLIRLSIGGIGTATNTKICVGSVGAYFGSSVTPTAYIDIHGGVAATAPMRFRSGVAPTAPNDGDIWFDGANIKMRIAGVTKTFTLV